jgi:adenylate cyclase
MSKDDLSGKLAVILHADVAGSTQLVQQDEQLAHERIQDAFRRFSDTIGKYHGRVQELRGDALLAGFERASDAVTAALSFQSDHADHLVDFNDDIRPEVRVGIALGEVVIADRTVTGAGVVLAQRVEQLAQPGGLCVTSAIHEALPNRLPFIFESLGEQGLKGFEDPVRVYRVQQDKDKPIPPPQQEIRQPKPPNRLLRIFIGAALLVVAGFGIWQKISAPREEPASVELMAFPLPDKPSIAVLPFNNMSSDAEQEYFADGMTEDLITDISKISGLKVIARHSTFPYKGQNPDLIDVGMALGATHIIDGSVRKSGSTLRITIQLIDASDGKHVWAERYDRELRDVFSIQDEIIGEIITALSLKLTPEEEKRVARHNTLNLDAYDLFMRGRQQESFFTRESFIEAKRYYEQVVALDPNYAEAWARLAQIHTLNGQLGWDEDVKAADQRALHFVEKAIAIDPDNPFSRFSYARILARDSIGRHDQALEEARKAVVLDPNFADAYAYIGQLHVFLGHAEQAIEPITIAMHINPGFPFWYDITLGQAYFYLRDFETAVEYMEKGLERNPNVSFMRAIYAAALAMNGQEDDAEWELEELHTQGLNKALDQFLTEVNLQDPGYKALLKEGLEKAGM